MEEIGKLIGYMKGVEDGIKNLNKEIYGNGQPGIRERLTRTEENVEQLTNEIKELKEMVEKVTCSVGDLAKALERHSGDKDVHTVKGLFLNKNIIPWLVLAFVTLHEIVELGQFNVLELAKKLFGIP